jgi:excisionase family DNA binding protein
MKCMSTPVLLATVEAAERLGIERSTLSRWVKEGRIHIAMRLPGDTGAMLFDPAEVDRVAADLLAPSEPSEVAG